MKKRPQKLNMKLLHFMNIFHTFALKIETSWAKSVVKPTFELEMSMLVCI